MCENEYFFVCLVWFAFFVRTAQVTLVIGGLLGIGWLIAKIKGVKVEFWGDE